MNSTHWDYCEWHCPICIAEYDLDEAETAPPGLSLVDSRDLSIEPSEIWEDGFDFNLWQDSEATEPVVYCSNCETIFDVEFNPRKSGAEE